MKKYNFRNCRIAKIRHNRICFDYTTTLRKKWYVNKTCFECQGFAESLSIQTCNEITTNSRECTGKEERVTDIAQKMIKVVEVLAVIKTGWEKSPQRDVLSKTRGVHHNNNNNIDNCQ